jgi:hypothetical protein
MQFTTASLMAMTTASMGVNAMQEFVKKTQFRNYGPGNYATTQRSRSKKYPEQSKRQALRMYRIQQGGPGLRNVDDERRVVPGYPVVAKFRVEKIQQDDTLTYALHRT